MEKNIHGGLEAPVRAAGSLRAGSSLGQYRVDAVLARGGMGIVYRATDAVLARPVALKVINPALAWEPGFQERFKRECRFAASLDDPHIVPVYAAGECEGVLYIAMRLVEGTDLRSLIATEGSLEPARAANIVAQVASALDAAHARGFVHRDVKPANVLMEKRDGAEHVYLTDFGIIKQTGSVSALTTTGHWLGTVDYVSPEQIRGDPVGSHADIYALGCVLYEALTGEVPYPRSNDLAKLWAHASTPPPSATAIAPEVKRPLAAVAQRAMAKLPDERYRSAGELGAAALAAARGEHDARPESSPAAVPPIRLSRLPAPLNRTIGREADRQDVATLVGRDEVRLVTLLGPGGVGKSRLALEVARMLEAEFADSVWFVELAATSRPKQVADAVATALAVIPGPGEAPDDALTRFLGPRRALVVLDNFEHLLPAARLVNVLLAGCPGLTVMTTSRVPLDIRAEHVVNVEPLHLPSGAAPDEVKRSPACVLFLERAHSHGARLAVNGGNAQAVASICKRLDGLPLAIELAAARVPMLEPAELNERLAHALDALGSAAGDTPPRQRTLRATIDWSCRLLEPAESEAFARFAVFAGGASVDSATEVTGAALGTLEALLRKQLLVSRRSASGATRLAMLETVREYAHEGLEAGGDAGEIHGRHAAHYLALAERADPHLDTHSEREWLPQLDADVDNLRAAIDWSLRHGGTREALRVTTSLNTFWTIRGRFVEGLSWLDRAIEAASGVASTAEMAAAHRARMHLLIANGAPYDWEGSRAEAQTRARAALELSRQAGDPAGIADALLIVSAFEATGSAPPRPRERALAQEALQYAREAGDERIVGRALMTRALALPLEQAGPELDEAAAWLQRTGDLRHLVWLYSNAGYNALMEGVPDRARPLLARALPLARELGSPLDLALACGNAGLAALFTGDLDRAQEAFDEQLRICADGVSWLAAEGLAGLAAIAGRRGDPRLAAVLAGAARTLGPLAEDAVTVRLRADFFGPPRRALGEEEWQAAEAEGAGLSFDEAIAQALDTQATVAPPATPD